MLFLLGRSLQVTERYEEAIERFNQYEAGLTDADTASAELYWRRGLCRYAMTQEDSTLAEDAEWLTKAYEDFDKAVEMDSTDARSISLAGTILNGGVLKRYEDSKWYFDRLCEMFPEEARYWYNSALPRLRLKQDVEALDFLMKAMASDTTAEGTVRESAREIASPILLKSGQLSKAREFYQNLISAEPNNCEHKKWYAYTYMALAIDVNPDQAGAKWAAAIPSLKRAYDCYVAQQYNPCNSKMFEITKWLAQAYALQSTPDWEAAKPLIEQGLKCKPGDTDLKNLEDAQLQGEEIDYVPGSKAGGQ
jgi:tetratricopeptide (TPR) repeat protein